MAWTEQKENGLLDLYIAANGNITANRNCKDLFCEYSMVKNWGIGIFKDRSDGNYDWNV